MNTPASEGDGPADLHCMIGTKEYYRARYDDFVKRHPGETPPSYYLDYGEKYARAFSGKTFQNLSPEGQQWLLRTRTLLQERMEHLRQTDPQKFDQLERDPEAFRKFAFETHHGAYLDGGLVHLPPRDLLEIARTPDIKDLIDPDALREAMKTGKGLLDQGYVGEHKRELAEIAGVVSPFVLPF